jgi:hypothetical protein
MSDYSDSNRLVNGAEKACDFLWGAAEIAEAITAKSDGPLKPTAEVIDLAPVCPDCGGAITRDMRGTCH